MDRLLMAVMTGHGIQRVAQRNTFEIENENENEATP